jgi:hypothetical protein
VAGVAVTGTAGAAGGTAAGITDGAVAGLAHTGDPALSSSLQVTTAGIVGIITTMNRPARAEDKTR